jgi:DNA mismatch endonuclease, patch repair protein
MMAAVRHFDTAPELKVRSFLHRAGFRFRVHVKNLPGRPDVVLRRYRAVVRIHGCFWHGHEGCRKGLLPSTNRDFWSQKIKRNRARDQRTGRELQAMGWRVLTVWECDVRTTRAPFVLRRLAEMVAASS